MVEGLSEAALDRAKAFYEQVPSIPGALAAAGLRGSDFILGWKRREDPLDIGFVDKSSMLDERPRGSEGYLPDADPLRRPGAACPVGQSGEMVFDRLAERAKLTLHRVHRQQEDNPILDLAHALADPGLTFEGFEAMVAEAAARDDRVRWAERVDAGLMARSPALVWRNQTRIRLIQAFRWARRAG